jgi:four helix bundle protein
MDTHSRLRAVNVMLAVVPELKVLTERIQIRDRNLADQIRRAATSVGLNLEESRGSRDGNSLARARTALGSLREVRVGLAFAAAWGYVDAARVDAVDAQLDRVAAMTWRLIHR